MTNLLSSFPTEETAIIYRDSMLSHCGVAIIRHYYRVVGDMCDEDVTFYNLPTKDSRIPEVESIAKTKKLIILVGLTPTKKEFKLLTKGRDTTVVWFDNHKGKIDALPEEYLALPGIRKYSPGLGEEMWKFFFSTDSGATPKIPTCISYIDSYLKDNTTDRIINFWNGMRLMETDPSMSQDFWESLFDARENLSDDASEDEVMERMKWDTMFQVVNMGAIVHTVSVVETEIVSDYAVVTDRCAYVNAHTVDMATLKGRFPNKDFVSWYYSLGECVPSRKNCTLYKYHVRANKPNVDAAEYASKFDGYGNAKTASFTTNKTPNKIKGI